MVLTGVPRATVPRAQAHRRARVLLVCAASGPVLGLLALAVALGHGQAVAPTGSVAGTDRAFAQVAAEDVLAGRPTQLPYAAGLDPYLGRDDGGGDPAPIAYRSLVWRSATTGTAGGEAFEVDDFVVSTDEGLWRMSVQVLDGPAGPVIGADPSLAPDPTAPTAAVDPVSYSSLPGVEQGQLGPGADRQLQAWAAAYVGGDPATLYRLTGDTGDDSFATLVGWVLDEADITGSVVKGSSALAQITVAMHLRADPAAHVSASYDVLLGALSQSLPWVQAWGPPGSGPTLTPLADALPARS